MLAARLPSLLSSLALRPGPYFFTLRPSPFKKRILIQACIVKSMQCSAVGFVVQPEQDTPLFLIASSFNIPFPAFLVEELPCLDMLCSYDLPADHAVITLIIAPSVVCPRNPLQNLGREVGRLKERISSSLPAAWDLQPSCKC